VFLRQRIKAKTRASKGDFRSGSMPRYGLSLTYNDCSLPNHHCKVNVPGLHLRLPTDPSLKAGVPLAPPLYAASTTASGGITAKDPFFQFRTSASGFLEPPLPFKAFCALPDRRVQFS
jgi:hypothetical protein